MIKVKNNRTGGSLFHYAHFICDCLFPEIINELYNFKEIIREKTLNQTLGNFSNIYTDVLQVKHTELHTTDFNNLKIDTFCYKNKEDYCEKKYFDEFREYIFSRYNINSFEYPEVLLIKRDNRINLIDDEYLKRLNKNVSTGKERREIKNIVEIEIFLTNKYKDNFKSLHFEHLDFSQQINYFNNAKLIICAHGAVMSNMFFCKKDTTIIEVTCNNEWPFFDTISSILQLHHIKCYENEPSVIIEMLNTYAI
jgi:hypothetical protein